MLCPMIPGIAVSLSCSCENREPETSQMCPALAGVNLAAATEFSPREDPPVPDAGSGDAGVRMRTHVAYRVPWIALPRAKREAIGCDNCGTPSCSALT